MNVRPRVSFTAIFVQDPNDKGFTGFFAELPEVVAEGDNEEEVQQNLFSALEIMLRFNKEEMEENNKVIHGHSGVSTKTYQLEVA